MARPEKQGADRPSALTADFIIGTRPEAIKLAPVVRLLNRSPDEFTARVITTGQQRDLCRLALSAFDLEPDVVLQTNDIGRSLAAASSEILRLMGVHFANTPPDIVFVQGDTTTAMTAALAAFYAKIPVAHVEAGLRSGDMSNPFPEEANRRIIDSISTILLPPTPLARENLATEGYALDRCPTIGNTVVDAMNLLRPRLEEISESGLTKADLEGRRLILVTTHRRESWDGDLVNICNAIRTIVDAYSDLLVALPVHPNPNVRDQVHSYLGDHPRIVLLEPLGYVPFLSLLRQSFLVVTDSGGVQEEAPSFGVPVLVIRKTTERPEAVQLGLAKVVGTQYASIVAHLCELLDNPDVYAKMANAVNPFGDGHASVRIASILRHWRCGLTLLAPSDGFLGAVRTNKLERRA